MTDADRARDLRSRAALLLRLARDARDPARKKSLYGLADSAASKAEQAESSDPGAD